MQVSVVVPARNAAGTLGETLGSLLAQSHSAWQAIVVDDGSTDGTADLVATLAGGDPRIQVERQAPAGVSAARNTGLALARAPFVLFLDADDRLCPEHLERLTGDLAADPGLDAACCGWRHVGPDGRLGPLRLGPVGPDLFRPLADHCAFAIHACLVRRSRVEAAGGFDPTLATCEDWDLWQRIARAGAHFGRRPEPLALYRIRPGSASLDPERLLADGLRVIARAHAPDPRVPCPDSAHAAGRPQAELSPARLRFVAWCAGLALGRGGDALHLLDRLGNPGDLREPDLDPGRVASALHQAVPLAAGRTDEAWAELWPEVQGRLDDFLAELEARTAVAALARRVRRGLERLAVAGSPARPLTLGTTHAIRLELTGPPADLPVPPSCERLSCDLAFAGEPLGPLELPVLKDRVTAVALADAAAADYAWPILGRFLARSSRPLDWGTFLAEVWGKPGWPEGRFYAPGAEAEAAPTEQPRGGKLGVEAASELPSVTAAEPFELAVRLGGAPLGTLALPGGAHPPQALRAAITRAAGFDLCRVAVREGLLGRPLDAPGGLRERLREAARTPRGDIRRTPNLLWRGREIGAPPGPPPLYGRGHFEALFAAGPDPWRYGNPYEETKYRQTLGLLPPGPLGQALELGCAEGHFTARLAPRVGHLLAADLSQVALNRAARRCRELSNVEFLRLDLTRDPLPAGLDLLVVSEVLYYLPDRAGLRQVAERLAAALAPGGHLLTAHAYLVVDDPETTGFDWDHPFGARVIGETFAAAADLHLVRELRTPLYRIQLFERGKRRLLRRSPRPRIEEIAELPPLPPEIASRVLWGGRPPDGDALPELSAPAPEVTTWRLPLLLYHSVAPRAAMGPAALDRYRVTPAAFEEQLAFLREAGFYTPRLRDWRQAAADRRPLPGRAVLLTFDDGYRDFATHAWPLLREYGFQALVFLVADEIGGTSRWDAAHAEPQPLLGWKEIRRLQEEGVDFGSHSARHRPLTALSPAGVVREASRSRRVLARGLGRPVEAFAYPHGDLDPGVARLVGACGYLYGLTCRPGLAGFEDPLLALPRIEIAGSDGFAEFVAKVTGGPP